MRFYAVVLAASLPCAAFALMETAAASAIAATSGAAHQAQVEIRIPQAPRAVRGSDGRFHLAYELHITNFNGGDSPLILKRLAVYADGRSQALLEVEGEGLSTLLSRTPEKETDSREVAIGPGHRQTLFLWLTLPEGPVPKRLRHRLDFRTASGDLQRAEDVPGPVEKAPPIRLGPPLRNGPWLAVEGPGNGHSHHWGSLVAVEGKVTIPQRYAIDWFGLDRNGHSVRGTHASLAATTDADWAGFDGEVLAVADGVVRDVRNDAPDGTPLAPQATPDDLTARTLYGNFVVLEIAPGLFAHYAHFRKGSVTAKIGDRVTRGTVIGRLGQSGNAGAPHLHLHLSDRPTFEQSEGLPFTIESFSLLGKTNIEQTFDANVAVSFGSATPADRHDEMPLDGDVIRFPLP